MVQPRCSDVVRFGGDVQLAPEPARGPLAAHLATCPECSAYVDQMATTRDLLRRHPRRTQGELTDSPPPAGPADAGALRSSLLARAELLDPANAEDLAQRALEVGLALGRRTGRARGLGELTTIMNALNEAQARFDERITPAVDVAAADHARAESLEALDTDADTAELFYPDLYPNEDGTDTWADIPGRWRSSAQILGPGEVEATTEIYAALDRALGELPEPLGDLVTLVDLQGQSLATSAQALGLDTPSAIATLARGRNHIRGRLGTYLSIR